MDTFRNRFPNLNAENHRITSAADQNYNCIAWALKDTTKWWQPGFHWIPADWPRKDAGIGALETLFQSHGYLDCADDHSLERGFEKVALYAVSGGIYSHAARQLPSGWWASKLGKSMDIEHDSPADLEGSLYGHVMQIMKRPTDA